MQTIILAAGSGTRMKIDIPKALLKIDGETLIERQLRQLREAGIQRVVIVTGFKADMIKDTLKGFKNIVFRYNYDYEASDNLFSFYFAARILDEDCLMLHCDLIFEVDLLKEIISVPGDIIMPIDAQAMDEESMKIRIEAGKVTKISKQIPHGEAAGESVPLMKFSRKTIEKIILETEIELKQNPKPKYLETVLMEIISKYNCSPVFVNAAKYKWMEIDTPDDYKQAKAIFGEE